MLKIFNIQPKYTFLGKNLTEIHPIASSRFLLSTTTEGVITTRGNRMKF